MIINFLLGLLALVWSALVRPGTVVVQRTTTPSRRSPTDTATWFVAGLCDKGPSNTPIEVRSIAEFVVKCGGRVSYSGLYDAVDAFFKVGGGRVMIGRVVGPAAIQASRNLVDSVPTTSLVVKAIGPGSSGNNVKVAVVAGSVGGVYQLQVTDQNNVILEQSPDLTTQQDAVTWAQNYSTNIVVSIGASLVPPVIGGANVLTALTSGADDRVNITDTQRLAALNLLTKDLGPGQVSMPGFTADSIHTMLLDHAAAKNRYALLDYPDTSTTSTLTTSATNAKTTGNGKFGQGFGWWPVVPGVVPGVPRTVPPSAVVAGLCAVVDRTEGPDTPVAGLENGVVGYATGLSQPPLDENTMATIYLAGVNVLRIIDGQVVIWGARSLADPINDPAWVDAANGRLLMRIQAEADAISMRYVFKKLDGQGHTLGQYAAELTSLLQSYWSSDQLYGQSPSEAFAVDVGPDVNTPDTIANLELRAELAVRPSPDAELVTLYIINVKVPQEVS